MPYRMLKIAGKRSWVVERFVYRSDGTIFSPVRQWKRFEDKKKAKRFKKKCEHGKAKICNDGTVVEE